MTPQKFYRYESKRYSIVIDADCDIYGVSPARLELSEYQLHSETPKGYWIGFLGGKDVWVSKTARKRYAFPTKEEAMEYYKHRKMSYVKYAKAKLKRAEEDLALATCNG